MPLYAVKNLKTGETQEFMKTLAEYEEWKKENPDWDKDWSRDKIGRMTVRYRQDYLRGIHGHPDHKDYGKPAKMTVTEENWDPNTPNEIISHETVKWHNRDHDNPRNLTHDS
tara:strand:+ start:53 stop:388 length:336 start_codon:yes stop_codon:yes gene_type:complete